MSADGQTRTPLAAIVQPWTGRLTLPVRARLPAQRRLGLGGGGGQGSPQPVSRAARYDEESRFDTVVSRRPSSRVHSGSVTSPLRGRGLRTTRALAGLARSEVATTYDTFWSSNPREPSFTRRCSADRSSRTPT
ncbi:hypothetical protein HEB94_004142 [Actinopolymorpha pittospori]|uniref:Uncharacterized protein n=1 Tax=Actinopolymorpha pittospori TaxID=648752 RepID=A0A927RA70_9ACTN|nr:hypothetical protein [Actinopolymorpha pittospori]MBE1607294.1 hypothetical protein [Actinopolymorpha pittospori]